MASHDLKIVTAGSRERHQILRSLTRGLPHRSVTDMRYKGVPSKQNLALAHPHKVALRIPEYGLGVRTDSIHPKVREIAGDAAVSWPQSKGVDRYAVHGFKQAEHAATFRAWIAEQWPELLDTTSAPMRGPRSGIRSD
jgi:hypothetical protein